MTYQFCKDDALTKAYQKESYLLEIKAARIGLILAFALTLSFSLLDGIFYPEDYYELLGVRLAFAALVVGLYGIFILLKKHQKKITFLIYVTAWSIAASISAMIAVTEGANSPYYAGLNFILIGMFLFPSTFRQTAIVSVGTLVIYYIGCLLHPVLNPGVGYDWFMFASNMSFLVGTGIIASLASHVHYQKRFETFRLNYELELRNQELAELDRLKSDFFANVSHELRTPLALILAPVQELLQNVKDIPEHVLYSLKVVETNTLRLLRLVNDILDIIRLEEGQSEIENTPIDINANLKFIVESMQHLARKQNIDLKTDLVEVPLIIDGDEAALEKIFINLIGNAIKFTEPGGHIYVKTQQKDQNVVIIIEDNGIGIPKKDLPYIFDRFRQADGSTTRKHQGLGLGLALVKELVENHKAHIDVTSRLKEGTTFTLSFPLNTQIDASVNNEAAISKTPMSLIIKEPKTALHLVSNNDNRFLQSDTEQTNHATVLVVDDEPDMRNFLVSMLNKNYSVLQATDGLQALNLVRETLPDLVLLDLMLPEIDGLEVCSKIKQDPETQAVKVILLTARTDESSKLTALKNGADDFLTKPFSTVEIRTRIKNLITTAHLERDLKQQNKDLEETLRQLRQTEAKLIHSEKLNALGTMAAGLLHEINNPINYSHFAVQTAQQMQEVRDSEDLSDTFQDIDEGLQRVRSIITDLKTFAYQNEEKDYQDQIFSLATVLEHAFRFTAHERKGILLNVDLPTDDEVLGHESHIIQVLVNLLLNAMKAMRQVEAVRPPKLEVTAKHNNEKLQVTIRDNGAGIAPEALSRIFDPFFSTQDVGEGMGLGLSICHTIISNHGGVLSAKSKLDEWTEFTFDLKRAEKYQQERISHDATAI